MLNLGLIVLACTTVCFGQSLFSDKCTLWPIRGPEVSANKDCSHGNIWWDYPRGNLSVKFEQDVQSASFKVCLSRGGAYLIDSIYDASNGANVPKPTEGNTSARFCGPLNLEFQPNLLEFLIQEPERKPA